MTSDEIRDVRTMVHQMEDDHRKDRILELCNYCEKLHSGRDYFDGLTDALQLAYDLSEDGTPMEVAMAIEQRIKDTRV